MLLDDTCLFNTSDNLIPHRVLNTKVEKGGKIYISD